MKKMKTTQKIKYRQTDPYYNKIKFGDIVMIEGEIVYNNKQYVVLKEKNMLIEKNEFYERFLPVKNENIIAETYFINKDIIYKQELTTWENLVQFKNKRELINNFFKILPYTANRIIRIEYYKLPNYEKLYEEYLKGKIYKNVKEYENVHRYGEYRIIYGSFIITQNGFKKQDGYYLLKDIENNNIPKKIIIRNLQAFVFDNTRYEII